MALQFLVAHAVAAQSWSWSYEMIDLPSKFSSLAVDANSNLHIAYADSSGALKYGFRPAGTSKWFTMVVDKKLGQFVPALALDARGNPQICYAPGVLKWARFDGQQWRTVPIAEGTGDIGYTCSLAIAKDGTPQLSWYQLTGQNLLHLRYAVLKHNAWLARTLDFDGETGKWNSMVLDAHDEPDVAYSAWANGELRFAHWNGKQWDFAIIDSRTVSQQEHNIGQGNSLALDSDGQAHISYYSEKALKHAHQVGNEWRVETVDQITWLGDWAEFRSSIAVDKRGLPHICYEDAGALKHAYSDGKKWHIQVLARNRLESLRYSSMALDKSTDTIYAVFRAPEDGALKLATGRLMPERQEAASTEEKQSVPQKNK